jgi:tetratricopeptide (TPR) repeat protein
MSEIVDTLMTYWSKDPDNASLIIEIISQLVDTNRDLDAFAFIGNLTTTHRNSDVVLLYHAQILIRQLNYSAAQILLKQFSTRSSALQGECDYLMGLILFLTNNHVGALALLQESTLKNFSNLKLQARILYFLSQRVEALTILLNLINENADAETFGLCSLILVDQAQEQLALTHAESALAQDPNQIDALIALATISINQQNFDLVPQFIDKALALMPSQGRVWSLRGQYLLQEGMLLQAEATFQNAIKLMPTHVGTQLLFAWSLWLQDKFEQSITAFHQAIEMDRNFAESHAGLSVALLKTGAINEAKHSATRALKLNPESIAAKYAQALLSEHEGLNEKAIQQITEIMQAPHYSGQYSNIDVVRRVLSERQGR